MTIPRVNKTMLREKAKELGNLEIRFDCGGCRVVDNQMNNVFPVSGICPTVNRKECMSFLLGVEYHKKKCLEA